MFLAVGRRPRGCMRVLRWPLGGGSLEVVAMPLVCACGVFGGKICGSVSGE